MELVNKNYIKMYKFSIFTEMVKAGATEKEQDDKKVEFFQNLLSVVMNYEKETHQHIEEFYIPIKDIDINDIEITRETIVNALIYACDVKDFKMIEEITPYLYVKRYKLIIGNRITDYILEHGISPDEYIDGEKEKLIYNSQTNSLEFGYIHNHSIKLEKRK